MKISEFMHTPAITCDPHTTLAEAARLMEHSGVGSLVVIDAPRRSGPPAPTGTWAIAGIITDRDLALRGYGQEMSPATAVEKLMTKPVVTIPEDCDVVEAAETMAQSGCRRLPVVNAKESLKGVVSFDDLTVLFARQGDSLAHAVSRPITPNSLT